MIIRIGVINLSQTKIYTMKKVLLLALFAFFSLFGKIYATDTSGEETTTINFADVTAIHGLTTQYSITHFVVGDFIIRFTPSEYSSSTTGNLLYRDKLNDGTVANSIVFYLGRVYNEKDKNPTTGDAITIIDKRGRRITKVEAHLLEHSAISSYFFTEFHSNTSNVTADNIKENTGKSFIFTHKSPAAYDKTHAYLQGLTITTEGPDAVGCETADKGEFEINLQNITFEEGEELRSAYMNFDLVARNDEMVDQYRVIVTNPDNESVVYCNELVSPQSAEASTMRAADQDVSRTIPGRVLLTKLNFSGETPVMISVRPELASHTHDSQPTVYTQKTTGADDIELAPDAATAEYFDINGTQISRPTPASPTYCAEVLKSAR